MLCGITGQVMAKEAQAAAGSGDAMEVARLTGGSLDVKNSLDEPHNVGIATETAPRTFPPASLTSLTFNIA